MKISKIIEKNLCYDSRKLKKNEIFFDFISNKKKITLIFKKVIEKKPYLIVSQKKINYKNIFSSQKY